MKGFIKTFFVIALCLAAVSCSDLTSPSNEETAPLPSPAEGTIRFDIEKKDRLSRSAVPQAFLTGIYYRLTVYKADEVNTKVVTKYQKTLSFTVPAPSWTGASVARLDMYCPTEDEISTDDGVITINSAVCMTGQKNFTLEDGTRVFNFTIDLEIADGETSGTINLPVTVGNTGVKSCIIVPDSAESFIAEVSDEMIVNSSVAPFSDHAVFYFFEEATSDLTVSNEQLKNAKLIYSDSITVFPNTTTNKWFGSDGKEKNVDLDSLQYSTMYVASNGDDKNGGSSLYPVKKLSTAIARCAQAENGGTIYLKSQPGDTEKIVIDKKVKIEKLSTATGVITLPDIEIKDFSSETAVSLKGVKISASGKTGITVGEKCSLTLDNVEVSGCEKGIYAEKECTVNLTNSTDSTKPFVVKDCTGYGIQLKNSSGILKINGTPVNDTTAATSSFDSCDLYYRYGKVVRLNAPCSDVSKNDDILKEAFNAIGSFDSGSLLLLGKTTSTSVIWSIKENGILVTTGTSGNTYTVKPVNSNCNVAIKRDSGASNQFVLLKSTASGTWKISNFTFEDGSNTTQTDASLNSDGKGGAVYLKNGTLDLTSCSFANNSAQNGGAVYIESGTVNLTACTIGGSSTAVNTAKENGGGFYLADSSASLMFSSGTISNNKATQNGGAIYLAGSSAGFEMNNGVVSSNSAVNGGGVYVASGAAAEIKGGRLISNSATKAGGAVYQGGTFKVSGYTYITPGSAPKSNDVYLASDKYVEVTGPLTPKKYGSADGSNVDHTAVITPSEWKRGTQVLTGTYAASNYEKFKGSESDWDTVSDTNDSNKVKLYTSYKIYVAGSSPAYGIGKSAADGGLGTEAKPYASIEEAVNQCWDSNNGFTIYLSGKLTGEAQTIPAKNTTDKTGLAASILLTGYTGNSSDIINRNLTGGTASESGTALTINNTAVVTIKNLTITGGNKTGHGGGINISGSSKVNLADNVLIYGNKASGSGGGVIVTSGGILCLSKNTIIGNSTGSRPANSSIDPTTTNKINKAAVGGGIFASGTLGLGKTVDSSGVLSDATFTGGIYTNISATTNGTAMGMGGGIYASGSLSVNEAATYEVKNNLAETSGGGMYCSFLDEQTISAGTFSYNQAKNGGAIYNDISKELKITKGTFNNNNATNDGGAICAYGTFTMTGGTITANSATGKGSAICHYATTFTIGGSAKITSDSGNDVYVSAKPITISDSTWNNTMRITPYLYDESTTYVSGDGLAARYVNFTVTNDADSNSWVVASSGKLKKVAVLDSSSISTATLTSSGYYIIGSDVTQEQFYSKFTSNNTVSNITLDLRNTNFSLNKSISTKPSNGITTVILNPERNYGNDTRSSSGSWQNFFNNVKNYIVPGESLYHSTEAGVLYNKTKSSIFAYPASKAGSTFIIPESVTLIKWYAFTGANNITTINIPQTCTLENDSFYKCSGLKTLTIEGSLIDNTTAGEFFMHCSNLETVNFTGSQTCIRSNCFWDCPNLTTITIPATITKVEVRAFKECPSLTTVNFRGTESQREAMTISSDNDSFINATWIYNYSD